MTKMLRPCFAVTGGLLALCCGLYPAVVTAGAQAMFGRQANGGLIVRDGKVVGSELIGQTVGDWSAHPEYLWGRASAASNDSATNITYSSGSNYGPSNATLADEVKARVESLRATGVSGPLPADLLTKSASGLDPDVSPASAELQVPRIAATRKIPADVVRAIVREHTLPSTLGFLGEPRVNVLQVNLALDAKSPYDAPPKPASSGSAASSASAAPSASAPR